ncbi:MAG: hypothetical protein K0S75_225 [Clostridia bacterium]|jgi:hypothetical protein|nr:hypothetical protein [Clostridia bacterium]
MYNNPYDYFRQQNMNMPNQNQMNNMQQDMGFQQPFFNQMPTMPMQPIQPMMPMGTVTGATTGPMGGVQEAPGTTSGTMPTNIGSVPLGLDQFGEQPVMDTEYTQGYLRTKIGSRVKIEFLIGTNMLVDREGTLTDVGISYIIINEVETDDLLLCDIYSIKFVRFYF